MVKRTMRSLWALTFLVLITLTACTGKEEPEVLVTPPVEQAMTGDTSPVALFSAD